MTYGEKVFWFMIFFMLVIGIYLLTHLNEIAKLLENK